MTPPAYRFTLTVRLLATACFASLLGYAWFVTRQSAMTFSTRRSGIVTLFDHQLDHYAVFVALCALLPLAVWFRSEAALRWSLIAWFLSILAALFMLVLAPVMR